MSGVFSDGESFHIKFKIKDMEFSGPAKWSCEDGLIADVETYGGKKLPSTPEMPSALPISIGISTRAFLIKPYISKSNSVRMRVNQPIVKGFQIRSSLILHDLPWNTSEEILISKIGLQCEALRLWYGEKTAEIESSDESDKTVATFDTSSVDYQTSNGTLSIYLNYSIPGWPAHGEYKFSTSIEAVLEFTEVIEAESLEEWAEKIEGFFDILAAFPPSKRTVHFWIEGDEKMRTASIRNHLRGGAPDTHPFAVFLNRSASIDIPLAFDSYVSQYEKNKFLQRTVRYLSNAYLRVPEGFLTACNLIESLGGKEAAPKQDLLDAAEQIGELVKNNPDYEAAWKTVDRSLLRQPSFKAKFETVTSKARGLGLSVTLDGSSVRDVRARYRHDIRDLNQKDIRVMSSFSSFAWLMGLVYLCEAIDIKEESIVSALANDAFHSFRSTGVWSWSDTD